MTKADMGDWKSPLGVYERAIAEIAKTREQFQEELKTLREIQTSYNILKFELQTVQKEIENLKAELQVTKAELETTKIELQTTKSEIQSKNERLENRVKESEKTAHYAYTEARNCQDIANTACSQVESVKSGIENGSIVANKALMLQGKDNSHWMKFCKLDSVNHHCFQIWKQDDNTWQDVIRVKASKLLRARDDKHWMKFYRIDSKNRDVFAMWRGDNTWYNNIQLK